MILTLYKDFLSKKYSKNTLWAYLSPVKAYATWLKGWEPEELIKYMVLQLNDYFVSLVEKYSEKTCQQAKSRLRYFFQWAIENDHLPRNLSPDIVQSLNTYIIEGTRQETLKKEVAGIFKEYSDWLQGLANNTIKYYFTQIRLFADWLEIYTNEAFHPENITPSIIKTYKETLSKEKVPGKNKHYKPGTINTKLMAVMAFCEFALEKGYIHTNPAKRIRDLLANEINNIGDKWLSPREQGTLVHRVEKEKDLLDIAMVFTLLDAGLRPSEVVALDIEDVYLYPVNQAYIYVRDSKRNKSREVPLKYSEKMAGDKIKYISGRLHEALRKYLEYRKQQYGSDQPALFINLGKRITYQFLNRRVKYYAGLAKIGRATPHSLRHSFCKNLVDQGVREVEVAYLAGHTKKDGEPNLQMVARYTKPSARELHRAINQLPE